MTKLDRLLELNKGTTWTQELAEEYLSIKKEIESMEKANKELKKKLETIEKEWENQKILRLEAEGELEFQIEEKNRLLRLDVDEIQDFKKENKELKQQIKNLNEQETCDDVFCYNEKYCKFCSCEMPKGHEGKHTNGFQVWENKK